MDISLLKNGKIKILFVASFLVVAFGCKTSLTSAPSRLLRPIEQLWEYRECQKGHARACYLVAEILAHQGYKRALPFTKKSHWVQRISLALQRACSLRDGEACAVLGIWLAHWKEQCSSIVQAVRKSCQLRVWYGCALAAFSLRQSQAFFGHLYDLIEEAKCDPGGPTFRKKLQQAICMYRRQKKYRHIDTFLVCRDSKYKNKHRFELGHEIRYWISPFNPIFRLIAKVHGFSNFRYIR